MVSITLAVPEEMKSEMDNHPEMNWSEVARQAIRERLIILKKMDEIVSKSKLTEKDALELGRKINKVVAKRFLAGQ
ncbi:hypothetical protein COV18_05035 [Candidatus Woesearchaeota archaeon CG10_big_fil_rev_8_21_14_0_10_37_12]|nr:MAG: hypothetical protein COV18_05035 [Candidatus Woesearchaeota archaeon CG10_big_fil_rev_8_21_14_0_10_37_12]